MSKAKIFYENHCLFSSLTPEFESSFHILFLLTTQQTIQYSKRKTVKIHSFIVLWWELWPQHPGNRLPSLSLEPEIFHYFTKWKNFHNVECIFKVLHHVDHETFFIKAWQSSNKGISQMILLFQKICSFIKVTSQECHEILNIEYFVLVSSKIFYPSLRRHLYQKQMLSAYTSNSDLRSPEQTVTNFSKVPMKWLNWKYLSNKISKLFLWSVQVTHWGKEWNRYFFWVIAKI